MLGDFNNTLCEIDGCRKTKHVYNKSDRPLTGMKDKCDIVGIWRKTI